MAVLLYTTAPECTHYHNSYWKNFYHYLAIAYLSFFNYCFIYTYIQQQTLKNGTTTASYFATLHLESTKELCRIIG